MVSSSESPEKGFYHVTPSKVIFVRTQPRPVVKEKVDITGAKTPADVREKVMQLCEGEGAIEESMVFIDLVGNPHFPLNTLSMKNL